MAFVKRFLKLVGKGKAMRQDSADPRPRCLVVDDSVLPKKGKTIEGVGMLWDHVGMRFVLGFRLLLLGYFDGKSFLPVNFSLHREKGKRAFKPYGLSASALARQFGANRDPRTKIGKRKAAMDTDKISSAASMIRKASKSLGVDYLLMDSWFTCLKMIDLSRSLKVKLIGMMKIGNAKYGYQGGEYTAKALLAKLGKKARRCRKLNAHYHQVDVTYKGHSVRLFFSRFGNQAGWQLVLSTDLGLGYLKTLEIYQIRWSVEVFFKEAKQLLNMGKCQAEDLAAQFCDITVTMMQYTMISLRKRFGVYETKGELFRDAESKIVEFTLDQRLWGLFLELVKLVIEVFKLQIDDIDRFMDNLMEDEKLNKMVAFYAHQKAA